MMDTLSNLSLDPQWVGSTAVVGLMTIIVTILWWRRPRGTMGSTTGIPEYPGTTMQFFGHLFGRDAPQHILDTFLQLADVVFCVRLPFSPSFYGVLDPFLARAILESPSTTKFDDAGHFFVETTNGMNFIAAKEGDRWKHARKSTSAAFSSDNMKAMVDVVHTVLNKWIQDQLSSDDESVDIDILKEMNKITSNVICEAAFDYDLKDDEREKILDCLQICWREFGQKAMTNPWRKHAVTKWAFPGIRQGHRAAQQLHAHCTKMLHEYRTRIHTNPQTHKIIHMIHNDTAYENDDERVCDMVAYCIAGFDTTANTLAFSFRELALNQSEQTKLRESLQQCHTPEEARVAVKHVAKEMMRLYPAAATGSVRVLGEAMKVPGSASRFIPKGSIVLIPIYAVQRNPQVFGSNANDFVPERWENPTPEQMKAFVNFVAGKRNCQGQSLAMAETTEVLARLCRDYKFDIVEAGQAEHIVLFKPVGTVLKATKVVV